MKRAVIPVPESGVLRACLDLLAAEKLFHLRLNSGTARRGKYQIKLCPEGTPDILCLLLVPASSDTTQKVVLWIETKGNSTKHQLTQELFQIAAIERGEVYLLVRDVDLLREWLIHYGVIKSNRGMVRS